MAGGSLRLQSALEYITTYSWAILMVAVVLGVLYFIGAFNPYTYVSKTQPGSCFVDRPNGPGTNQFVSLEGTCLNEEPEYVMQFNGQNAYVSLGNSVVLSPEAGSKGQMTLCIWYDVLSTTNYHGFLLKGENAPSNGNLWEYAIGQGSSQDYTVWASGGANIASYSAATPTANKWYFACFTFSEPNSQSYAYIDGTQYAATWSGGTASQGTGNVVLGAGENGYSDVELANLQLYNTSLDANEVTLLYDEGIGGDPVQLPYLVGWWPLNGNADDYSGNGNNGNANSVKYTSGWASAYTAP